MGAYTDTISPVVGTDGAGGFFIPEVWDLETRRKATPLYAFRQFAKHVTELSGGSNGDTIHVIKRENINTAGTNLTANTTIPRHSFTEGTVTYTPKEWGNAISPESRWLKLSPYSLQNELTDVLARDAADVLDREVRRALMASVITGTNAFCMGAGGTVVGTTKPSGTVGTAVYRLTAYGVWAAVDYLAGQNAPMVAGGDQEPSYIGILHPAAARGIKRDGGFIDVSLYGRPGNIFNNEIGKWEGVRWIQTTQGYYDTTNLNYGALILGANAFGEDVVQEVQVRRDPDTDFGRQLHFAWYGDMDFQVEWANYIAAVFGLTGSP